MHFEFTTPAKIIFGAGKLNSIGDLLAGLGDLALVISGAPHPITDRLLSLLKTHQINFNLVIIEHEPTVDAVRETIRTSRQHSPDLVIGIGGGSALDTAKAISALLANPGDVTDYMEIIGANKPLAYPSLPLIAVPTTAGTGSEVTKNAVIGSPVHHVKVSLRSTFLLPRIALVDPELTLNLSPEVTAFTGMDALTQLIEPYTCNVPNPLTDALCKEGILRIAHSLKRAYDDGQDLSAREDMSLASLFNGLALANARLGAVHALAGPVGGLIEAHHGVICASLLPHVTETNVNSLIQHDAAHPALAKYTEIARLLTGKATATVMDTIGWIRTICEHMKIQRLSDFDLAEEHFPVLIEKAMNSSSMKGNPVTLSEGELRNILRRSL